MNDHINLLPLSSRKRIAVRMRLMQWAIAHGIALAVLAGFTTWQVCRLQQDKQRCASLETAGEPLRSLVERNQQVREQLKAISGRESLLNELEGTAYPLTLIGLVSRGATDCRNRLHVSRFVITSVIPTPLPDKTKRNKPTHEEELAKSVPVMHLDLAGMAVDDLAVAQFVAALRESGVFDSVELKSSVETPFGHGVAREYQVACTF